MNLNTLTAQSLLKVGETLNSDGSFIYQRGDRQGAAVQSNLHGKFTEQCRSKRIFSVSNQAAVATTAALATTWTGLGLTNPSTSQFNAAILEFGGSLSVVGSDDGSMGLMYSATTTGMAAAITPINRFIGGPGANVIVDDGATIGTPVLVGAPFAYGTGATNLVNGTGPFIWKLDGSLILPPGTSLFSYTTTATTAAFIFYFVWEEIPI